MLVLSSSMKLGPYGCDILDENYLSGFVLSSEKWNLCSAETFTSEWRNFLDNITAVDFTKLFLT